MRVYLAGLIDNDNKESSTRWREKASTFLKKHCMTPVNPLRGKDYSAWGSYEPNEIVDRDLMDINNCDLIIANMTIFENGRKIPFGTPCEIMYAYTLGKPTIFISNNEKLRNHYWVRRLCSKVHTNLDEALDYIVAWYKEEPNVMA